MAKGWGKNQALKKEGKRFCSRCKEVFSISDFHPNTAQADGLSTWCKSCSKIVGKDKSWKSRIKHHYGLTPVEYYKILADQNGLCAICKTPANEDNKRLAVDHCHTTGKVRGLLCFHCNTLLGHCFEKLEILLNAADYIRKHYNPDDDPKVLAQKLLLRESNGG